MAAFYCGFRRIATLNTQRFDIWKVLLDSFMVISLVIGQLLNCLSWSIGVAYFSTVDIFCLWLQQCERGVAENNNGGGRGCGGCESRCAGCAGACGCCAPRPAEPPPPPQCSPGAVRQERGQEQCAGCGRRIKDRFFLQAVERRWHEPCLRCCECHLALDSELTCFAKDGNIFCKKDYYKSVPLTFIRTAFITTHAHTNSTRALLQ